MNRRWDSRLALSRLNSSWMEQQKERVRKRNFEQKSRDMFSRRKWNEADTGREGKGRGYRRVAKLLSPFLFPIDERSSYDETQVNSRRMYTYDQNTRNETDCLPDPTTRSSTSPQAALQSFLCLSHRAFWHLEEAKKVKSAYRGRRR